MITLHPPSSVSFTTNGYGSLSDYTDCLVIEEINGMFELTMKYPIFGIHYSDITQRCIIYCKPNPYTEHQPFRIYAIGKPINGIVTINAAHISYDLSGYPVSEFEATSPTEAFNQIKANAVIPIPFQFNSTVTETGKVTVAAPRSARSIMGNNILRAFGGEYEFNRMMIYHTKKRGMDRGFAIRYGRNLLDINQEENIANVYTAVYPYWIGEDEEGNKHVVKLPEKTVPVEGTFDFQRILTYDVGEDMYEKPTVEQMRELTKKKIKAEKIGVPTISIDAEFIQLSKSVEYKDYGLLEEVRLGDELDIEFLKLGISAKARCIKTTYNPRTDMYESLELGDAKSNLSSSISNNNQAIADTIAKQEQKFDAEIGSIKIDLAQIDTVIADKVDANWVSANFAHITNGYIDNAQIKDLDAGTITTGDLAADIIKAGVIEAINMRVDNAVIKAAKIADLSADKITTGDLDADRIKAGVIEAINISTDTAVIKAAKIGNLSADKITTGTLDADRIGAGTITANKIAIGDFTNYAITPTNAKHANVNGVIEDCYQVTTQIMLTNKLTTLEPDDKLRIKGVVYRDSGTVSPLINISWRDINDTIVGGLNIDITEAETSKYKDFNIEIRVPRKQPTAAYCNIKIQQTGGVSYFHNLSIMRKSNGELIVDGAITADKIDAGAITADKIDAKAITAELIKGVVVEAINLKATSAVIDAAKIGNLSADKITTGFLSADRIKAGSLAADKINANDLEAIKISAAELTANKIAAGEIKVGDINITDGTISFAKIYDVKITNAMIDKAFIADSYIKVLDAGKITTGTLDASRITVKNLKADSIIAGSLTIQGENLIRGTKFEDVKYWSHGAWVIDNVVKFEGENTLKVTTSGATADIWKSAYSEPIAVTPNDVFVGSIYLKTSGLDGNTDNRAYVGLYGLDAAGKTINIAETATSNNFDFTRFVVTGTVPANAVKIRLGIISKRNGTINAGKPMLSRGSIASIWKPHTDELISDGAIDNDKLGNEAVTSDKLMTDELFVGDNAFIKKLKAVDIDAANITTGTISNDRININGLVSFEAFDETLQMIFNVQGDKTYINGGMIATNTIKADKLDLLSGLTVMGSTGKPVFSISKVEGTTDRGTVEIDGLLKSGNFDEDKRLGYKIDTDGTAILNQAKISGEVVLPNAGMTNYGGIIGNPNLVNNSDFLNTMSISSAAKNPNLYAADWSQYNGGVTNPTQNYHSYVDNTTFDFNTVCFNESDGTRHWKALSKRVESSITNAEGKYKLSMDVFSTIAGAKLFGGFYYTKVGGTTQMFHAGQFGKYYDFKPNTWERVSFDVPLTPDVDLTKEVRLYIYAYGFNADGILHINKVKLEEDEVDTPWCVSLAEQFNYVRIWAGSGFSNRDNAPFRVYQNGDVFASNGTFSGLLQGTLDSGDVQIYDNEITIHNPGTENEMVKINANRSVFNTDLSIGGNKVTYSKGSNLFNMTNTNFRFESVMANILMDTQNGALGGLNIFGPSGGQHVLRGSTSPDKSGALVIDSEGGSGPKGDVVFMRKNGAEDSKVTVDGELNLKSKLTTPTNGLELRFEEDGWGFYAI